MNRHQDRGPLYTLTQVAERTGIHPMLLDSYLQTAAWRVPTVWVAGEERYPREALTAFQELHEEAQAASAPAPARPEGDGPNWGRRRLLSITAQRRNGAARGAETNGHAAAAAPAAPDPAPEPEPAAEPIEEPIEAVEAAADEAAAPRRPTRPLFTLQQVHEHTGIPYPALALYAASESRRIPAAGERYAPLYPWEALHVFCDIHHERNPSWPRPDLAAVPPDPEEDAAARALAARLERLERAQSHLAAQIRMLIEEDEPFLSTTVSALHSASA